MPSIGILEMIIILVAILVFIRPEDLPKFLRTIGKFYGQAQRYYYQMKMYSRQTFDDISRMDQPPPDPSDDPWHDDSHDDHYHDEHYHDEHHDYHDHHHDEHHDEHHDQHHQDEHDPQHHEYEAAYAVGDACEAVENASPVDATTSNDTPAEKSNSTPAEPDTAPKAATSAAPETEKAPAPAPTPSLTPEPAAGTVGRGDSAPKEDKGEEKKQA